MDLERKLRRNAIKSTIARLGLPWLALIGFITFTVGFNVLTGPTIVPFGLRLLISLLSIGFVVAVSYSAFLRFYSDRLNRERRKVGCCGACGYNLCNLREQGRCPECGIAYQIVRKRASS